MPPRDVRMYLHDIIHAGGGILRVVSELSPEQYAADEDARMNIERRFEIIGEALRQAMDIDPSLGMSITDARRIVDFRNVLIHAYHMIDYTVVWDVVENHLPVLLSEVRAVLEDSNRQNPA